MIARQGAAGGTEGQATETHQGTAPSASGQTSSGSPPPPPPTARRDRAEVSGHSAAGSGPPRRSAAAPPDAAGTGPAPQPGKQSLVSRPPVPPERKLPATAARSGAGPPDAPPTARRVARLITTDKSATQLEPAADGKLPELRLADSHQPESESDSQQGVHPLVLLALLSASVVASIAMLFVEPGTNVTNSELKRRARREIEADYFANLNSPGPEEPYQFMLREAQRAFAQGNYQKEQEQYRRVLKLLRAERGRFESVTGSRNRDKRLEELLILLLGDP